MMMMMMMLRRHRPPVERLPHDLVELILERLPVKSLLRFKCVSRKWRSTIDSQSFRERQSLRRRLSRGPDVLFVRLDYPDLVDGDDSQRFTFGSSSAYTVTLPKTASTVCNSICDGLVCLYNVYEPTPNVLVNPATGWHQSFPLSSIQHFFVDLLKKNQYAVIASPELGFGKDKVTGTYKAVWLYNSAEYGLGNVTTCEVFNFSTKAWRYVVPASPRPILALQFPVHFDGSLSWLTTEGEVLSFDLHTETFQVVSKAPFPHAPDGFTATMCVLDNHLCVSQKHWSTQVIWWFHSSSGTWNHLCSIDLTNAFSWFRGETRFVLPPVAILDKNKILLRGRDTIHPVVVYDLDTKSCDLLFTPANPLGTVTYFESLLSVL
uniref:F-box protein n=1 Tax=Noccaea caerulescens TaxID=107243 RepID=A0A1J3JA51_NOCCA